MFASGRSFVPTARWISAPVRVRVAVLARNLEITSQRVMRHGRTEPLSVLRPAFTFVLVFIVISFRAF
jgi:hypothetical protein